MLKRVARSLFGFLAFGILFAKPAAADDAGPSKEPANWPLVLPGFTAVLPSGPHRFQRMVEPGIARDGSDAYGAFTQQFGSQLDDRKGFFQNILDNGHSTVVIEVSGMTLPVASDDPKSALDVLVEHMRKKTEDEAASSKRLHYVSSQTTPDTVAGAHCVRWDAVAQDTGVPQHEGTAFTLTVHRLMCAHPDNPDYIVRLDYSQRLMPGDDAGTAEQDGLAFLKSLGFTHWGMRVTTIELGILPQEIAATPDAIWVSYGGRESGFVARIDPKTNHVVAKISVGHLPIGIAADASGVWVVNSADQSVSHIDPATNTVVGTIKVGANPQQIASGAGALWVVNKEGGAVSRIDPATGNVSTIEGVGVEPAGIAFANGLVVVTDFRNPTITRIDPATNTIKDKISGGLWSNFVVADGQNIWVNDQHEPAILRLGNGPQETPPQKFTETIGDKPTGIALFKGKLWVANWYGGSLSMLDPQTPNERGSFLPTGRGPLDVVAAAGALWVTIGSMHTVLRLDPIN